MVVSCVFQLSNPPDKTEHQTVTSLEQRITNLGAKKKGDFCVECSYYSCNLGTSSKVIHVLSNSEQPVTCFIVAESGNVLIADNMFFMVMSKLAPTYEEKKSQKIECRGSRFSFGDFLIKVGCVFQVSTVKGILVEVEYQPAVVLKDCWGLLKEFVEEFFGANPDFDARIAHCKDGALFHATDIIQQYLDKFNLYRNMAPIAFKSFNK